MANRSVPSGNDRQRLVDHIVAKSYDKHAKEFSRDGKAVSPAEFRRIVGGTLSRPGTPLHQKEGINRLHANPKEKAVAIINSAKPHRSTVFKPRAGVEAYMSRSARAFPPPPKVTVAPPKATRTTAPTAKPAPDQRSTPKPPTPAPKATPPAPKVAPRATPPKPVAPRVPPPGRGTGGPGAPRR